MPLFSMPMAIDWVSPKPFVGEWQPEQLLSLFRPADGVEKEQSASVRELAVDTAAQSRSSVDSIAPVKPCRASTASSC